MAFPTLDLAERVAATARELGIETALVGAAALAVHNFVRATQDVDLASSVDLFTQLRPLAELLNQRGLKSVLRTPDEDDPLGGLLKVWHHEDEDGEPIEPVEIVNFRNPYRPGRTPAPEAIRDALPVRPGSALRYVGLPDLVALKLYAASRRDLADIVDLLARNPTADLDAIRARARPYDTEGALDDLIAEAGFV